MKNRNALFLFSCTLVTAWGVFAAAQDAGSERGRPYDPCGHAPNREQVEDAARHLERATHRLLDPLKSISSLIRDDHSLREPRTLTATVSSEGVENYSSTVHVENDLQQAATQIRRFIRAAESFQLSESAMQGYPTLTESRTLFQLRSLLNRAHRAVITIQEQLPGFAEMRRPFFTEIVDALYPYRSYTYRIAIAPHCSTSEPTSVD